jgi:hypothetical protein
VLYIPQASLFALCPLCNDRVELETASTDEMGKILHEECYVAYLISRTQSLITIERALSVIYSGAPGRLTDGSTLPSLHHLQ